MIGGKQVSVSVKISQRFHAAIRVIQNPFALLPEHALYIVFFIKPFTVAQMPDLFPKSVKDRCPAGKFRLNRLRGNLLRPKRFPCGNLGHDFRSPGDERPTDEPGIFRIFLRRTPVHSYLLRFSEYICLIPGNIIWVFFKPVFAHQYTD